jgi:hypothetical protein
MKGNLPIIFGIYLIPFLLPKYSRAIDIIFIHFFAEDIDFL